MNRPHGPQRDGRHQLDAIQCIAFHKAYSIKNSIEFLYFWNSINFVLINICNYAQDANALDPKRGFRGRGSCKIRIWWGEQASFDWTPKSMKSMNDFKTQFFLAIFIESWAFDPLSIIRLPDYNQRVITIWSLSQACVISVNGITSVNNLVFPDRDLPI